MVVFLKLFINLIYKLVCFHISVVVTFLLCKITINLVSQDGAVQAWIKAYYALALWLGGPILPKSFEPIAM